MATLGEKLKNIRKQNNLSMDELASLLNKQHNLNISKSMISRWENNKSEPINTFLSAYAIEFDQDLNYLLGIKSLKQSASLDYDKYDNIMPITTKRLPLLGEIACGEPRYAEEDRESYIEVGTDIQADFCLKAHGDSMIDARIFDGDVVFIRKQSIVNNGEIAAVIIDGEATLKRIEYSKDRNIIVLKPENPKYDTLIYANEELEQVNILGKAIAFQSDIQ